MRRELSVLSLATGLLLIGCVGDSDKSDTDATETGDTTTADITCAERSLDTCEADDACGLISASPTIDDGDGAVCVDYSGRTPVGCIAGELTCTSAEVVASHESDPDNCWVFGSGCLPDGWTECSAGAYSECPDESTDTSTTTTAPSDCASVAPEECDATTGCAAIDGYPVLTDKAGAPCVDWASPTPLGCMSSKKGCDDIVVIASDPAAPDEHFFFTNACLPDGWSFLKSTDYPACE